MCKKTLCSSTSQIIEKEDKRLFNNIFKIKIVKPLNFFQIFSEHELILSLQQSMRWDHMIFPGLQRRTLKNREIDQQTPGCIARKG